MRKVPFSKTIFINKDDFDENPPKGYYRLTPDQPVRLKHAYIITCKEIIKDNDGKIIEIKATYHPNSKSGNDTSGIKVKSAIQWVDANEAKKVEVRLYDRLYSSEAPEGLEDLNCDSLKIIKDALIEPAVIAEKPDVRFQFEREGYFYADPVDYTDENPVFNKIVSLKDSWGKNKKSTQNNRRRNSQENRKNESKKVQIEGVVTPMSEAEQALFDKYTSELGLNTTVADILARDTMLSSFYEEALLELHNPLNLANIVANDVARELKEKGKAELKFTASQVAQLVAMIDNETISTKIAKQVFEQMVQSGDNPKQIVEAKGLIQISDPAQILPIIEEVIDKNPENVEKYKAGNNKLFGFFVGQVLKATGGKANPKVVNELVTKKLHS